MFKIIGFLLLFFVLSCTDELETEDLSGTNPAAQVTDKTTQVLLKWNDLLLELDRYSYNKRPVATARSLAYIQLAAFETAAPDMISYKSCAPVMTGLDITTTNRGNTIDQRIAMNAAYARVVRFFMAEVRNANVFNKINILEAKLLQEASATLSNTVIADSRDWGRYVANRVIAYSETDTNALTQMADPQPRSYVPAVAPGNWTFSADAERALFPFWGTARSFVKTPLDTRSIAPLDYNTDPNSVYHQQMLEVQTVSTTARIQNNANLWIAEFWSDDVEGLMMSPPTRQFSIANQLTAQFNLDAERALAMYLKVGLSLNDAAVATWHYKYQYMVMRPNVYIRENLDTNYQTNLFRFIDWPNPSFPSYPSGHSAFASAAAGVFISELGDNVAFTDRTHENRAEFRGFPRRYSTLSEMAQENAYSRIPLGVHMRMDCDEGLRLGYEIARDINRLDIIR